MNTPAWKNGRGLARPQRARRRAAVCDLDRRRRADEELGDDLDRIDLPFCIAFCLQASLSPDV